MKRIAAFILLMLYFVTTTGATLHYHYCMGEIANFSLWDSKEKNCGKCGMEKKENEENGCCRDEQQWIKISDDQKVKTIHFEISKPQIVVNGLVLFNDNLLNSRDNIPLAESKAPLRSCELTAYLLNCVFRI